MSGLIETLRTGSWLTRQRIRLWALAVLAASLVALAYLLATASGLNDYQGRPLGTDFSNVYAAGTYVRDGRPEAAFDPALQHAREKVIFGDKTPFYGWHYPPFFLVLAGALALLPYGLALLVWQAATLLLYLGAIRAIVGTVGLYRNDRLCLLLALAYPAVFINLGHGHNGFLTAALIGFALVSIDRRPILAGMLFGLLAYKPQFGLMIPLVLVATGRWRVVAAAAATVLALIVAATLAFGVDVWRAFLASTEFTRVVVLETGGTGWHKIQSVFSWARAWGSPIGLAYAVQLAVTLGLAAALVWLWRGTAAFALKAATLCLAAILATPYSLDYDMMVLAPAIAFLAVDGLTRGFRPWEASALAALWLVPLVTRTIAEHTLIPFGVLAMLTVSLLLLRSAANDRDAASHGLSQAA
jgi:alpha-1,2-mannosyltransferase